MFIQQTDVPVNPLIRDTDAVVGNGLLCCRKMAVPEAARQIGIGETKLREIIRRGDIPVIRILGKILLLERDLEVFLQSHYGSVKEPERKAFKGLPPLPKHVQESSLLRKAG